MGLVEGVKMKAKRVSKNQLIEAWKKLSSKPLPKVEAFKLSDEDFDYVIQRRHCLDDDLREIEEWGRTLSTKSTDACVFEADEAEDADYVILIRKNPYHSLDDIIIHELSHIARGDL